MKSSMRRVGPALLAVVLAAVTACSVAAEDAALWVEPGGRYALELPPGWEPHDEAASRVTMFEGNGATVSFQFAAHPDEPWTVGRVMALTEADLKRQVDEVVLAERFDLAAARFPGQLAVFEIPSGPLEGHVPAVGCILLDKGAVTIQAAISDEKSLAAVLRLAESVRQPEGAPAAR